MQVENVRRYNKVQFAFDLAAVLIAWESVIRFRILFNPLTYMQVSWYCASAWVPPLAMVLPIWTAAVLRLRVYRMKNALKAWDNLVRIGEYALLLSSITAAVTFFSRRLGGDISRSFVLFLLPTSFLMFVVARYLALLVTHFADKHWPSPLRIALLGDSSAAMHVVNRMGATKMAGAIRGLILPEGHTLDVHSEFVPVLGTTSQLAELINREQLDRIIVLNGSAPRDELESCNRVIKRMGVTVDWPLDFATESVKVNLSTHYGLPLVEVVPLQLMRGQQVIKRIFDIFGAAFSLVLFSPPMLLIAILVKLTSEGPVLYKAQRVGKGGRYFPFLKFRSMYTTMDRKHVTSRNEKNGHIFKMRNDPRVTPIGRFIRRYSLDELPQLINVLRGEMSLVGPRPLPAGDLDPDGMSRQFATWAEARSQVHPGITGLWQIRGRSELPFEDMIRYDLEYIQNWSLALDLKIMFETPALVLKGVGAY
jgi:exopolysaccharide biosynthesis polyprenyl glycosylphosphotransferase